MKLYIRKADSVPVRAQQFLPNENSIPSHVRMSKKGPAVKTPAGLAFVDEGDWVVVSPDGGILTYSQHRFDKFFVAAERAKPAEPDQVDPLQVRFEKIREEHFAQRKEERSKALAAIVSFEINTDESKKRYRESKAKFDFDFRKQRRLAIRKRIVEVAGFIVAEGELLPHFKAELSDLLEML